MPSTLISLINIFVGVFVIGLSQISSFLSFYHFELTGTLLITSGINGVYILVHVEFSFVFVVSVSATLLH